MAPMNSNGDNVSIMIVLRPFCLSFLQLFYTSEREQLCQMFTVSCKKGYSLLMIFCESLILPFGFLQEKVIWEGCTMVVLVIILDKFGHYSTL